MSLALSGRVRAILKQRVTYYRDGVQISAAEASRG